LRPDATAAALGKGNEVLAARIERLTNGAVRHEKPLNRLASRGPRDDLADRNPHRLAGLDIQCHCSTPKRKTGKYSNRSGEGKGVGAAARLCRVDKGET